MKIELADKVAALLQEEVDRCNRVPKTKAYVGWSQATATEIVNDILWLALRKGDISKGWKS